MFDHVYGSFLINERDMVFIKCTLVFILMVKLIHAGGAITAIVLAAIVFFAAKGNCQKCWVYFYSVIDYPFFGGKGFTWKRSEKLNFVTK